MALAQEAVALSLDDWTSEGGTEQDVTVWLNAGSDVCIWVNGGGTTPSATGEDDEQLTASVADHSPGGCSCTHV